MANFEKSLPEHKPLDERKPLEGCKFLVSAGPTVEAIDPVRFISNHSTGKMGYAVAAELAARGAGVVLVSGPTTLDTPAGVRRVDVVSAGEMFDECMALWPGMDGAVMCAAVADYTPAKVNSSKIKKPDYRQGGPQNISIELTPTRDIAAEMGRTKRTGQILIGFALETDNEEANATDKLIKKNLDAIVLNSLRHAGAGFGGDTNRITLLSRNAAGEITKHEHPLETKKDAASRIVNHIEQNY